MVEVDKLPADHLTQALSTCSLAAKLRRFEPQSSADKLTSCRFCYPAKMYRQYLARSMQECFPASITWIFRRLLQDGTHPWLSRAREQLHSSFLGSTPSFATVAFKAAANDIFPRCRTTMRTGYNMVHTQFVRRLTLSTVLASMIVSGKQVFTAETNRLNRHSVESR